VIRYRCKDVSASFAKMRGELMANALQKNMPVILDDGEQFHAEAFELGRRVVYLACRQGSPYVSGPSIIRRYGAQEYVELFLPKN
jgi:hypothetical protein